MKMHPSVDTFRMTDVAPMPMPETTVPLAVPPAWMQARIAAGVAAPKPIRDAWMAPGAAALVAAIFRPETVTCSMLRASVPARLMLSRLPVAVAVAPSDPGALTVGVPEKETVADAGGVGDADLDLSAGKGNAGGGEAVDRALREA